MYLTQHNPLSLNSPIPGVHMAKARIKVNTFKEFCKVKVNYHLLEALKSPQPIDSVIEKLSLARLYIDSLEEFIAFKLSNQYASAEDCVNMLTQDKVRIEYMSWL